MTSDDVTGMGVSPLRAAGEHLSRSQRTSGVCRGGGNSRHQGRMLPLGEGGARETMTLGVMRGRKGASMFTSTYTNSLVHPPTSALIP